MMKKTTQVSTLNIVVISMLAMALLMVGLVVSGWLSTPICYAPAPDPAPPYNETDAKVLDPDDLPWDNETDIIILVDPDDSLWDNETDIIPITPYPITNETDVVIIEPEPLDLNLRMDKIDAELISLWDNIEYALDMQVDEIVTLFDGGIEMDSRIDVLETHSDEVDEQIANLEDKISRIQTIILYACIATIIIAMFGAYILFKQMEWRGE